MKSLGFYVRLIAIAWLFGMVMVHFGKSWIAPMLPPPEPAATPAPLAKIVADARPSGSGGPADPRWQRSAATPSARDGWGAGLVGDKGARGNTGRDGGGIDSSADSGPDSYGPDNDPGDLGNGGDNGADTGSDTGPDQSDARSSLADAGWGTGAT